MFKKIEKLKARQILDSRGIPTLEVEIIWKNKSFFSSVPSGTSKGENEALEIRDGDKQYLGMGVLKAAKNINQIIFPKLKEKKFKTQEEIDRFLLSLDGTENKSKLGANAILGVSLALARLNAFSEGLPLYRYLGFLSGTKKFFLPSPFLLMIEGASHSGSLLDIQEFMVVPCGKSFAEKLRKGVEIYQNLKKCLENRLGKKATNVGLEGAFAPELKKNYQALDFILEALKSNPSFKNSKIVLDIAASHFYSQDKYFFEEKKLSHDDLKDYYFQLIEKYPLLGLEDPFSEKDIFGWQKFSQEIKKKKQKILIIGDDLTVTNPLKIKWAGKENLINALIVKVNQIGTVSEALEAIKLAKSYSWKIVVSHRSGETNDDFIADLAVGVGAEYVKFGAPNRGERIAKYNRLLKIEEDLGL